MRECDTIHLTEERRYWRSRDLLGNAIALYDQILAAYNVLTIATNENGQLWEGRVRPLYLMVSACRYDLTMAMMTLFRGHAVDAYYHVRSAVEYAGASRLMREKPELEVLWAEAETNDGKMKAYRKQTPSGVILPETDDLTRDLKKQYDEASTRIHSSSRSMYRRVARVAEDADRFDYFDEDKRDPKTLFEPYLWIAATHRLILALWDGVFADELAAYREPWEGTRAAAINNLVCGSRDLLGEDVDLTDMTNPMVDTTRDG